MQTDPKDVITAYEYYLKAIKQGEKGAQGQKIFVKGKRKNRRLLEAFFTFGMQIVTWLVLKKYLSDINAQPKLFSREFYQKFLSKDYPSDFSLDLFALYRAKTNGFKLLRFLYISKKDSMARQRVAEALKRVIN